MAPEEHGQRPAVGVAELLAACAAAEAVSTPPAPEPEAVAEPEAVDEAAEGAQAVARERAPEQHAA